ncbi:protein of unknown function [Candidatus Hydrogenisulfobacillus filiaventi]|uniref:Uncharacterized protein n=1 Tax=Candidatus Hydrogenisulfobacillus filiaventi TaxID=2707344 RepID=A0A6F8ZF84_9FIRM|nr:protein of unknown function [Candidatus Hydrogenisulfobacillus filiaventi]
MTPVLHPFRQWLRIACAVCGREGVYPVPTGGGSLRCTCGAEVARLAAQGPHRLRWRWACAACGSWHAGSAARRELARSAACGGAREWVCPNAGTTLAALGAHDAVLGVPLARLGADGACGAGTAAAWSPGSYRAPAPVRAGSAGRHRHRPHLQPPVLPASSSGPGGGPLPPSHPKSAG